MPSTQNTGEAYPMVSIQAGEIQMRDDRKKTQWTERLNAFLLAPLPVTNELYDSIMQTAAAPQAQAPALAPVVEVSWHDAIAFCNLLSSRSGLQPCYSITEGGTRVECDWTANGYRLPTESEWQYACKAGTKQYQYGELDEIAWYRDNAGGRIQPAGRKQPNAWGLYDMLGNVWEWCWDLYDVEVYGTYRVFRGGSWAEEARGCGATCRRRSHPTFRIDDLGFRLARSC